MHTFSQFVRPYQRLSAAFPTVPVGNQIAEYFRVPRRDNHGTLRAQIVLLCALSGVCAALSPVVGRAEILVSRLCAWPGLAARSSLRQSLAHEIGMPDLLTTVTDARSQAGSSAGEVLRAFFGEMAVQRARGLADFDHVAVRVSHVAADLRLTVDWRRDELRALGLPFLVAGLDVSDPQVQEDRRGVAWLVVDHGDAWLVGGGRPAGIHQNPRVGQLDDARVLLKDHGAAQDARVEVPGPRHAADGDEHGHDDALGGRRQVGDVNVRRRFCHALTFPRAGTAHTRRDSARPRAWLGPAAVPLAPLSRTDRGGSPSRTVREPDAAQPRLAADQGHRVQTSVHRQGSDRRSVPIRCAILRQYPFGRLNELTFHRL